MSNAVSNNRKLLVSAALIAVISAGAYGLARVYPSNGVTQGTVVPSDRYEAPQIGAGDATIGDTAVAQLMQTDAFEALSRDKNFRALVRDPNFARLAQNPKALVDFTKNNAAFAELGHNPNFQAVVMSPSFSVAARNQAFVQAVDQVEANAAAGGHSLNGRSALGYTDRAELGSGQVAYIEVPNKQ
jgi:hypothetical protein